MTDVSLERWAVLTMDFEDWYHLDYLRDHPADRGHSMLDGVGEFSETLDARGILGSFFVVGELATRNAPLLRALSDAGHEIGCHGWDHSRPLTMPLEAFIEDTRRARGVVEDAVGRPVTGYRAPCFSLDRARLDVLQEMGFQYDSSRIAFKEHPLYGHLDVSGFDHPAHSIYTHRGFVEFEATTAVVGRFHLPMSGGYLRLLPWPVMRALLRRALREAESYILYLHPFELSTRPLPPLERVGRLSRARFSVGRRTVRRKLECLISLLQTEGFQFTTFSKLREAVLRPPGVTQDA